MTRLALVTGPARDTDRDLADAPADGGEALPFADARIEQLAGEVKTRVLEQFKDALEQVTAEYVQKIARQEAEKVIGRVEDERQRGEIIKKIMHGVLAALKYVLPAAA